MELASVWRFLHHFFTFAFVGTLVVAEWNARAARAATNWGERALLFRIVHLSSRVSGLGSLVLLGVFGHLLAVSSGYRMGADAWLRWVTALWLAAVAVMAFAVLPAARQLAALSAAEAAGGVTAGFEATLRRWRLSNVAMTLFYLMLLAYMVFRWRG